MIAWKLGHKWSTIICVNANRLALFTLLLTAQYCITGSVEPAKHNRVPKLQQLVINVLYNKLIPVDGILPKLIIENNEKLTNIKHNRNQLIEELLNEPNKVFYTTLAQNNETIFYQNGPWDNSLSNQSCLRQLVQCIRSNNIKYLPIACTCLSITCGVCLVASGITLLTIPPQSGMYCTHVAGVAIGMCATIACTYSATYWTDTSSLRNRLITHLLNDNTWDKKDHKVRLEPQSIIMNEDNTAYQPLHSSSDSDNNNHNQIEFFYSSEANTFDSDSSSSDQQEFFQNNNIYMNED